jgi:hypothetical protein
MQFSFSENTSVDSLEKVPSDFHGLYEESGDGGFRLRTDDPTVGSAVQAVTRMSRALSNARSDVDRVKRESAVDLSPLEPYGSDPTTIAATVEERIGELEAALSATKSKKGEEVQAQIDKIKSQMGESHGRELSALKDRVEEVQRQRDGFFLGEGIATAVSKHGGDAELMQPFISRAVRVEEVDGPNGKKAVLRVVDGNGEVRFSPSTAEPMTLDELVKEFKANEKFAPMFSSRTPSGGGQRPTGSSPANPGGQVSREKLSSREKMAMGLAERQRTGAKGGPA